MPMRFAKSFDSARAEFVRKNWPSARQHLHSVLALEPDHHSALLMLSLVESNLGRYRAARDAVLRLHSLHPADPKIVAGMLGQLRVFNQAGLVLEHVHAIRDVGRIGIPLLLAIASQLSYFNLQHGALRYLDEAWRADPDYPPVLIARAQVLMYQGRFAEALENLQHCLEVAPGLAPAYWLLSRIRGSVADDNHVDILRGLLGSGRLSAEHVVYCGFALHNELDFLGDPTEAWSALDSACRTKRKLLAYDSESHRHLIDSLVALPLLESRRSFESVPRSRVPVFIVGMHRSGTTLLEQLLDASPQLRAVGELYDFTSAMRNATDHHCRGVIDGTIVSRSSGLDFSDVGRYYIDGLSWRLGEEPFFTDKLPSNFLNIGFICQALPQAKILHMVRDPMETCFSNLRELFSEANAYSYDQVELADYFIQYRRLMAHWHQAYPGRILDVSYAELTADPAATMRQVAEFCGIDFIDAMTDTRSSKRAVATASAVQVREGVRRRDVAKWVPYAKHLQPLMDALRAGGVEVADPAA